MIFHIIVSGDVLFHYWDELTVLSMPMEATLHWGLNWFIIKWKFKTVNRTQNRINNSSVQYSDSETPVEKLNPTSSTDFRYKTLCIIFLGHPVFVKTFVFPAPFGHNYGPLSRQILGQSVVFTAHLPSMSILGQRQTQYYPLRRERKRLKWLNSLCNHFELGCVSNFYSFLLCFCRRIQLHCIT